MGNDVTAVFGGDIGPMNKAMAQLKAAAKANAANIAKDLTFTPRIDDSAIKAATANIQAQLKQWNAGTLITPSARDFKASNAYLDEAYSRVQAPNNAGRASAGAGGNGLRNAGNVGLQVQDIAVQLQMGTAMTTILAQQGSQLASVFGPRGMLIGAGAAVGGVLLTIGSNANKAFDGMITGASNAHKEITSLLETGGVKELTTAMGQLKAQSDAFAAARAKSSGISGALVGGLGVMMGGDSKAEQEGKMIVAEGVAYWDKVKAAQKVKEVSAQDLQIAQLRSKGLNDQADGLERQIALARTLAEIDQSAWKDETKADLKRDAIAMALASQQTKFNERDKQETDERLKKNQDLNRSLQDQKKGLADDRLSGLTGADRLKGLEQLQQQRRNDATVDGLSLNEKGIDAKIKGGDLAGAEKSLKALREYEATQREIAALQKSMQETSAKEAEAKGEKDASIQRARVEFSLEQQISQAIASSGAKESAKAKELQDQLTTMRLQKTLMDQLNISAGQALTMAQAKVAADNASAAALKAAQQAQALQSINSQAAINNARAHGHTRKAERLESAGGEEAKKDALIAAGVSPAEAAKRARGMQRDEDKIAGRAGTIRGGVSDTSWGIGSAKTPGLDAMAAKKGKPLADEFQFPGLTAHANRQAKLTGQMAKDLTPQAQQPHGGPENQMVNLMTSMLTEITALNQKINVLN